MTRESQGGQYKRIGELAKAGDFSWLVEPLDYLLMDQLPDEGTNVGGMYQLGATVNKLGEAFPVGSNVLSGRLRALSMGGLVRKIRMVAEARGRDYAWQKTVFGKEVLEKWKAQQPQQ